MPALFRFAQLLAPLSVAVVLSACGGSGSSTDSDPVGPAVHTVSATAGIGGSINPSSHAIEHGDTATFEVNPQDGYSVDSVSGCNGTLVGAVYTTDVITGACTVSARFRLNTYTVSSAAGTGGSVTPTSQVVNHGATTELTVTWEPGFSLDSVTGCGGSLTGNTYTTGPITGDCIVNAQFIASIPSSIDIAGAEALVITEADLVTPLVSHLHPLSSNHYVSLYKIDSEGNYRVVNILDSAGVVMPWPFVPTEVHMLPGSRRGVLRFKDRQEFWIFELDTGEIYLIEGISPLDNEIYFDLDDRAYVRVRDQDGRSRLARFDLNEPANSAIITPPQHSVDRLIVSKNGTAFYTSFDWDFNERILTADGEFRWLTDVMSAGLANDLPGLDEDWATVSTAWLFQGDIVFLYAYEPLPYVGSKYALIRLRDDGGVLEPVLLKDLYELHNFFSFEAETLSPSFWLSASRMDRLVIGLGYTTVREFNGTTFIGPEAYIHVEVGSNWIVTPRGDENERTLVGACDISDYTIAWPFDIGEDLIMNLVAESCDTGRRYIFEWNLVTGVPAKIFNIEDAGVILESMVRTSSGNVIFEGYRELDGARYIGQLTKVGEVYEASIVIDAFLQEPIKIIRVN